MPEPITFNDVILGCIPFFIGWLLPSVNYLLKTYKVAKYAKVISDVLFAIDPLIRENINQWGHAQFYDEARLIIRRLAGQPLNDKEVEFILAQVVKAFDPGKFLKNLRLQDSNPFKYDI
jgi:hypothetical protein